MAGSTPVPDHQHRPHERAPGLPFRRDAGLGRVAPQVRRSRQRTSAAARCRRRADPGRARPSRPRCNPGAVALRGRGRDIATAATGHPRAADLSGCLVELDEELAAAAREHLATLGSRLDVRAADAGDPDVWADVVPVDLLLLCGIFGNVPDDDVERTVLASSAIGRPGATVIWTRHRRPPDLTPAIRGWFTAAGCTRSGSGRAVREASASVPSCSGCERALDRSQRLFAFTEG